MNALRKKKKNDDDIATLSAVSKVTSKKYLDDTGLGRLLSLIVSFVRNYAAAKTHNHDGVYAKSSHTHTTAQVTGLDSALAGKASTSHNHNGVYAPSSHNHSADNITSGVLPVGRGGTGSTNSVGAASTMLNALGSGTAVPRDDDWYVAKYAEDGNDTPIRRTHSALWSYIKAKTDALYQPKGSYAAASHTHTIAQVTNLQSQLDSKVPVGRLINKKPLSTDMTLTPADIGADADGAATNALNSAKQYTDTVAAGKAAKSHNHDAGAITSGTLPIHRGGTGATDKAAAANSLGVYSLNDKTSIPANADLNTYKTAGTYVMTTDVNAATLKNCPTGGVSFTLWVDYILSSTMYIAQKVQCYNNGRMYHRESFDSGSSWNSWKVVLDSGNYNSYVPTKTGGGASGTWGINVTGSAGSVPWTGVTGKPSTFTPSSHTHTIANVTNLQSSLDSKQPKGSYAAASHNHGTVTDNFTVNVEDTTTDSGWSMIGGNNGHLLKSIRTQAKAPSWLMDNFGAGIAFGGMDTKGVVSIAYDGPRVRFAGGNGTKPLWNFEVSGAGGKAYNLDNMSVNGHSHDASAITSGILPVSRGGTGHTNLVDSANSMIDSLTVEADTPTDNEYVISQVANGGVAHKKPMSSIWTWIKYKCDAIYQVKGSYASTSHTHSWSQITGKPSIPSPLTCMPVGYVYISYSSTSPASLFGGSWVAITGRFPYFNAGTGQGGSNSHTLSVNEIPSHNHSIHMRVGWGSGGGASETIFQTSSPTSVGNKWTESTNYTGGSAAHNNMPAYQTLYAWRRTA